MQTQVTKLSLFLDLSLTHTHTYYSSLTFTGSMIVSIGDAYVDTSTATENTSINWKRVYTTNYIIIVVVRH